MRSVLFILLLFVGPFVLAQTDYDELLKEHYKNTVPTISPKELYQKIKSGQKIHLLDTRSEKEYNVSQIYKARHVGFLGFSAKSVKDIPKEDVVIVYCTIGARSESVGEKLQDDGYSNVYNLYGGIIYWVNRGYPVHSGNEKTTKVHVYSKKWGKWLTKGKAVH